MNVQTAQIAVNLSLYVSRFLTPDESCPQFAPSRREFWFICAFQLSLHEIALHLKFTPHPVWKPVRWFYHIIICYLASSPPNIVPWVRFFFLSLITHKTHEPHYLYSYYFTYLYYINISVLTWIISAALTNTWTWGLISLIKGICFGLL